MAWDGATMESPDQVQIQSDLLRWRDRGGAVHTFGVRDQVETRHLVRGRAWSKPPRRRGQPNRPGDYYFASLKRHVAYASLAEASLLLLLDFQGTVADVLPQPFQMRFLRGATRTTHVPDYFVLRDVGTQEIWDVRPFSLIDGRLKEGAALTREFCAAVGFAYYLFDDVKVSVRRNLEWLHAYADDRYAPSTERRVELEKFFEVPGHTIAASFPYFEDSPQMLRMWIFHMLWHRSLTLDLDRPLNDVRAIRGRSQDVR